MTVGLADGDLLELHACNAHCAIAVIAEHANIDAGALVFAAPAAVRSAVDQLDGIREDLHDRPIVQGALDNVRDALSGAL